MAKKTFADRMQQKAVNPTLQFISQPAKEPQNEPQTAEELRPDGNSFSSSGTHQRAPQMHRATLDEETKSRRLQLLLTPTLYEAVKERAAAERLSVNELINSILRDAMS